MRRLSDGEREVLAEANRDARDMEEAMRAEEEAEHEVECEACKGSGGFGCPVCYPDEPDFESDMIPW